MHRKPLDRESALSYPSMSSYGSCHTDGSVSEQVHCIAPSFAYTKSRTQNPLVLITFYRTQKLHGPFWMHGRYTLLFWQLPFFQTVTEQPNAPSYFSASYLTESKCSLVKWIKRKMELGHKKNKFYNWLGQEELRDTCLDENSTTFTKETGNLI